MRFASDTVFGAGVLALELSGDPLGAIVGTPDGELVGVELGVGELASDTEPLKENRRAIATITLVEEREVQATLTLRLIFIV